MEAAREQIKFLSDSPNRTQLLAAIDDGPAQTSDLAEACDVSRWTVNRAVDKFDEWGWVDAKEERIAITGAGKAVLQKISKISRNTEPKSDEEPWETFKFFVESENMLAVLDTIIEQPTLRPADSSWIAESVTQRSRCLLPCRQVSTTQH